MQYHQQHTRTTTTPRAVFSSRLGRGKQLLTNFYQGCTGVGVERVLDAPNTVNIGFCNLPPSEGSRLLKPARPLKQGSGYSDQVVAKARVWI